jgi:hypothetical protein
MPSLKKAVRVGKKRKGSKKAKSFDTVRKKAAGKGVKNPAAYTAAIFRAQGVNPRTGKKTKKRKTSAQK